MSLEVFCVIFFALSCSNFAASVSKHPIVLIVSFDGFRYDYIDSKGVTPVLKSIQERGTYADYMDNVFTTKTFPNHHSIATGFYPEVHGILGNTVYDPKFGQSLHDNYEFWHYSEDILPIWIANEKKGDGRYSGVMMWPGSGFNYSGISPTYSRQFKWGYNWEERVNEVLTWMLDKEKPANLVMLYFEEPDSQGHQHGTDAPELVNMLKELDKITKYLLDRLNATGLSNLVNIFFLSDHGMEKVQMKDKIDLNKFVAADKFDSYECSPISMIYPKEVAHQTAGLSIYEYNFEDAIYELTVNDKRDMEFTLCVYGQENFVYNALKNASESGYKFKVYKNDELPERWHYKNNRRTPPILAVADPPYIFFDKTKTWKEKEDSNFTATENEIAGYHGYDNSVMSMKPFFIAVGPQIKKNHKIKPFENVDLFSLWANMLGFSEVAVNTNGSYDRVADMLEKKSKPIHIGNICGVLFGIILTVASSGISYFLIKNKLRFRRKVYSRRSKEESLESRQRLLDNLEAQEEEA